jgi:hypothetical protein
MSVDHLSVRLYDLGLEVQSRCHLRLLVRCNFNEVGGTYQAGVQDP